MAKKKRIMVTIGSREKRHDDGDLPAQERYVGMHINYVRLIAEQKGIPFFILSGLYGLTSAVAPLPYYDYELQGKIEPRLVMLVVDQLHEIGVEEIIFYTKHTEGWAPYRSLIAQVMGAVNARTPLNLIIQTLPYFA